MPAVDLLKPAVYTIGNRIIEVFDCVEDHLSVLKPYSSFDEFKTLLARPGASFC